jgi:hypothetical protein
MASSLFFHPENGCDMFLQKFNCLSDYIMLYPRRKKSAQYIASEHKGNGEIILLKYTFHKKT